MKKIIVFLFIFSQIFLLVSCGKKTEDMPNSISQNIFNEDFGSFDTQSIYEKEELIEENNEINENIEEELKEESTIINDFSKPESVLKEEEFYKNFKFDDLKKGDLDLTCEPTVNLETYFYDENCMSKEDYNVDFLFRKVTLSGTTFGQIYESLFSTGIIDENINVDIIIPPYHTVDVSLLLGEDDFENLEGYDSILKENDFYAGLEFVNSTNEEKHLSECVLSKIDCEADNLSIFECKSDFVDRICEDNGLRLRDNFEEHPFRVSMHSNDSGFEFYYEYNIKTFEDAQNYIESITSEQINKDSFSTINYNNEDYDFNNFNAADFISYTFNNDSDDYINFGQIDIGNLIKVSPSMIRSMFFLDGYINKNIETSEFEIDGCLFRDGVVNTYLETLDEVEISTEEGMTLMNIDIYNNESIFYNELKNLKSVIIEDVINEEDEYIEFKMFNQDREFSWETELYYPLEDNPIYELTFIKQN